MKIDELDDDWKPTLIGPKAINHILSLRQAELLEWVTYAYKMLLPTAILPPSIAIDTPNGNRFADMFAFLGGKCAGSKLIASHVSNVGYGFPRSYSDIVIKRVEAPNEREAGKTFAYLDGTGITAARTTLGACLVARLIRQYSWFESARVTYIGCGRIAQSCVFNWMKLFPKPKAIKIYDIKPQASEKFIRTLESKHDYYNGQIVNSMSEALKNSDVVCFATTELKPHVQDIDETSEDAIILHLSLRDLSEKIILDNLNIVDDINHVCTRDTSLHLAKKSLQATEKSQCDTSFVTATVTDLLMDKTIREQFGKRVVYSPFGLAVLDIYFAWEIYNEFIKLSDAVID